VVASILSCTHPLRPTVLTVSCSLMTGTGDRHATYVGVRAETQQSGSRRSSVPDRVVGGPVGLWRRTRRRALVKVPSFSGPLSARSHANPVLRGVVLGREPASAAPIFRLLLSIDAIRAPRSLHATILP